jgi:chemotaxis protein methyltransferase WspC
MNLAATVTQLLSERLGLSPELLGFVVVERALNTVMGKPGPHDREERIARLLQGKGEEWETLVDEIIVPETWFFRGREPFRFLACYLEEEWRPANPTGPFQVLCIPCASGEEPYSVAITALDAGLEAERIRIDAGDVSGRTLDQARRAVYGRSSFREKCRRQEEKYFLPCSDGQRVRGEVAALVRFEKANLLDLSVYRNRAPYHAVFCRNAVIYLQEQARREVMSGLRELLHEDGLLFTGHSELIPFLQAGFRPVDSPQSFACRKGGPVREVAAEAAPAIPRTRKSVPAPSANAVEPLKVPQAAAASPPGIEKAKQLADRGQLAAAAAICERLLAEGTRDADIYCLLGVINESGGQLDAAEDLFRKALFLDPHHYHSLVHMSLLCERRGDTRGSRLHRARAERVFARQQGDAAA